MEMIIIVLLIINILLIVYFGFIYQDEKMMKVMKRQNELQYQSIIHDMDLKFNQLNQNLNVLLLHGNDLQSKKVNEMIESNYEFQEKLFMMFHENMKELYDGTELKLSKIERGIHQKLDDSLTKTLDDSFKQVSDHLSKLYISLGELNHLSSDISFLNHTLNNVKNKGIWGEVQLASLLENTLSLNQYDKNINVLPNSHDRVEFAIKIPQDDSFIYLPIDSKYPLELYKRVLDASEACDKLLVNQALKQLEQRIKQEAKMIKDKYILTPYTTDFAIMFLPSESLYSEVVKIDGLIEYLQSKYKILVAGPSTLNALLNAIRVGFSNIALHQKSEEVLNLLKVMKSQFEQLFELIEKTSIKLNDAQIANDKLKDKTRLIQKKMNQLSD